MADETGTRRRVPKIAVLVVALAVWVGTLIAGIVVVAVTGGGPITYERQWDEEVLRGTGDKIAMIEIAGEIVAGRSDRGPFGATGLGSDDYLSMVVQAREDESVRAVIVRIDTPGGAVVPSDDIYEAIADLSQEKPVVALLGDVAASGGYYIAAGANEIVAHRATITGSIGVIAIFPNLEGAADKLGVRPVIIKSGRFKDIGSPFHTMTPEERRILQSMVGEAFDQFVAAIVRGRSMPAATVRRLADGRVYSGAQAEGLGLVDHLGGLDRAVERCRELAKLGRDPQVVRYVEPPLGFGDLVVGFSDIGRSVRSALRDVGADVAGLPRRPGMHYLWVQ